MNIALITDNFIPELGGVTNVMVNVSSRLTELGEKVLILNNTYKNEKKLCFKIISSDKTLKSLKSQDKSFYFFLLKLFYKIIITFKGIKFNDKLKLGLFYGFYLRNITNRVLSIKNLVFFFKKQQVDVILSGTSTYPLFYSFILSKWYNIPMATIAHGDDFISRYPLNINTLLFQNVEKVIVTNRIMKKLFLKIHNVQRDKVKIIHLGVDVNNSDVFESKLDLRKMLDIPKEDFIILTVSRFYPRKGFDTVLKAIKLIIDENPKIPLKYLVIGSGEEQRKIEKAIIDLKLESYVKLLGSVEEDLKNQYYKLSDLFILVPEVKKDSIEGFGIVYIEANYLELPVIGSKSGGVKVAIEDGKTGFLVKPNDEIRLKEKILNLYHNGELCKKMGEYGRNRVIDSFNWYKNAIVYQNTLKEIVLDNNRKKNK